MSMWSPPYRHYCFRLGSLQLSPRPVRLKAYWVVDFAAPSRVVSARDKTNQVFHIAGVKRQIETRPYADFEYAAVGSRNNTAAIGGEVSPPHR